MKAESNVGLRESIAESGLKRTKSTPITSKMDDGGKEKEGKKVDDVGVRRGSLIAKMDSK
jgi:hypothetical protein